MADASYPLRIADNDGWLDLELGILGHQALSDEIYGISVFAREASGDIGFNLLLPRKWTRIEKPPMPHYESSLWIASLGGPSNTFLRRLRALFGQADSTSAMADCTEVGAFVLRGNPENVAGEPIATKLFFGTFAEYAIPYAECFLDVDVPAMRVQLREKDPDYRISLLAGLERGTDNPFK